MQTIERSGIFHTLENSATKTRNMCHVVLYKKTLQKLG